MNGQDTIRNLLISAAAVLVVMFMMDRLLPQRPVPQRTTPIQQTGDSQQQTSEAGTQTSTAGGSQTSATGSQQQSTGQPDTHRADRFSVSQADGSIITDLGGSDPDGPFRTHLTVSNLGGGGIETATLADHAETLDSDERYVLLHALNRDGAKPALSLAVESVTIEGTRLDVAHARWQLVSAVTEGEAHEVVYALDILDDGAPAVRLTRTLTLPAQALDEHRHDLFTSIRVDNLTDREYRVGLAYLGGLGVPGVRAAKSRMDDRLIVAGVAHKGLVQGESLRFSQVAGKSSAALFDVGTAAAGDRFSWIASCNAYFTCTVVPLSADRAAAGDYIVLAEAVDWDGNKTTQDDILTRVVVGPTPIAGGLSREFPADVYIGEKDSHSFQKLEPYKARNFYYQIQVGFGSCTFTALVKLMIWLLNTLFYLVHDFGIAIVILVFIVRGLLHPVTKKGQVNMVRMQKSMGELGPKMEEIKKKYANDNRRQQQEITALYAEAGVSPFAPVLSCLPLLIQMPIWVALFMSLYNNINMRHEPFLFGITWIDDLTAQDALIPFSSPVTLPLMGELTSFNLLPILLAVSMFVQQKLQPKPAPNPNMTDQQRSQQDMMKMMMPLMSIMMAFFFYKMPSGLNLYVMASSLIGTIEQYRIRHHIREQEAAGTLHKKKPSPPRAGGQRKVPGFLARLQAMAEEAHKAPPPRKDKKR